MSPLTVIRAVGSLLFFFILPFLAAGTLRWWQAWVYLMIMTIAVILSRVIVFKTNPDLLKERGKSLSNADTKSWDKPLSLYLGLLGPMSILIIAGLDFRFGWTPPLSQWLWWISLMVIMMGYILATWAMVVNRFFSAVVRIQTDRGHKVVNSGPYHFIRHPGYAGGLLGFIAMPFLLCSLWACLPALIAIVVTIYRTAREDAALQAELPGYAEFCFQTKYRLLPLIW